MRELLVAVLLASIASVAHALEYSCPSDPGFCYFDRANDGCFDPGTDDGPIEDQLALATFFVPYPDPAEPGSIVCPPSVTKLKVEDANWRTEEDGDVLLFAARLAARIQIESGGRLHLGGGADGDEIVTLSARDDVSILRKMQAKEKGFGVASVTIESTSGGFELGSRGRLICEGSCSVAAAGDIVLAERSSINAKDGFLRLDAGGWVFTDGTTIRGAGPVDIVGAGLTSAGRLALQSGVNSIQVDAGIGGPILIDQLKAKAQSHRTIGFTGGTIEIGRPVDGKIRTSTVKGPASFDIDASGPIRVERTQILKAQSIDFTTGATEARFVAGRVIGSSASPSTMTMTAGAGSTCDITGSLFKATLVTNCDTVIGP